MSPILYLAAALVSAAPLDVDDSSNPAASRPIVRQAQHQAQRLHEVFGAPVEGWIAAKQPVVSPFGAAENASPGISIGEVFSQRTHWATAQQPTFLQTQTGTGIRSGDLVIRAQDGAQAPGYDEVPKVTSDLEQPILLPPVTGQAWTPPGGPMWGGAPNGLPIGGLGATGAQPYRFGSQWKIDIGYLPKERTNSSAGRLGHLSIFEINTELRHTIPTRSQYIWSFAPQFNVRAYNSNPPAGTTRFPSDTYRFGADIQLTSPSFGGYKMELGFTPSFNTDFEQNMTSDSWSWDGRGALFFRSSPQYELVLGAMYWDRVDDKILPWAGWVYSPSDCVEIRAVFPKPEISWSIGTPWGIAQRVYVAGEYHIEAYQVEVNQPGLATDRMELEDWRVVMGIRSKTLGYASFLEAGWVFGREVEYLRATTPAAFDISSGFIARFGMKF
jgi:hypothetical protein